MFRSVWSKEEQLFYLPRKKGENIFEKQSQPNGDIIFPHLFHQFVNNFSVHYLENVFPLQLILSHFDKWVTTVSSLIYETED